MFICKKEEDLICKNCICAEPSEDSGFVLCNACNDSMGELSRDDAFCMNKGQWAAEVTVTRYKRLEGSVTGDGQYDEVTIRIDERSMILQAFMNDGKFEW